MKNVKVILMSVLFSTLGANVMQAQDKPAQAAQPAAQTSKMANQGQQIVDQLGLTKEQQTPYKELIKRFAMEVNDVRTSALDKDQKAFKYNELALQKEAEIKALLTPEQYTTYLKLQEERKVKFMEMKKQQTERQEAMKKEREKKIAEDAAAAKDSKETKDSKDSKETKETKPAETKTK